MDYIVGQLAMAGQVSARAMFGEFGIYCDGKMVASVCDNQLFVKITRAGKEFCGPCPEAPPYSGAKPNLLIAGDKWDDADWLSALIKITTRELPEPKPKKVKVKK